MDRSYLSDQAVVAASRTFVCVRLLTYESAAEAEMLQRLFRGRDGLENTVFSILDSTGSKQLVRSGRSPAWAFDDAADMAAKMHRIAAEHPGRNRPANVGLPLLADVRRGLNAARADAQLLVIIRGQGHDLERLEAKLAQIAWSEDLIGKLLYARADDRTDWSAIHADRRLPEQGLLIVEPGEFGLDGQVLASFADLPTNQQLLEVHAKHDSSSVDTRRQRRRGMRAGARWETEIPVTDRHRGRR